MQWNEAGKGNYKMMIWLGKQMLGQKDKHDHTSDDKQMGLAPMLIVTDNQKAELEKGV
jgi:hypothetical protein